MAVLDQTKAAIETLVIGSAYILVSAGLIAFNKYMMQPHHFPHAVHLTTIHMTVTTFLSFGLYAVAPQLFSSMSFARENIWTVLKYIAPLGAFFSVALLCSNLAYAYSTVAFLQFCKQGNVALIFAMSCIAGLQAFSWRKVGILAVVLTGCTICAEGEIKFVWLGLLLQLASQFAECSKNILGEIVMTGAGLKLDVLTFVAFQAICSLIPLGFGAAAVYSSEVGEDFLRVWPLILINAGLAFILNLLIALTLKRLSALAFVIIGLVKDAVIVASSSVIFADPISHKQRFGFIITMSGIALWSYHKMQEQAAAAEKKAKETDPLVSKDDKAVKTV